MKNTQEIDLKSSYCCSKDLCNVDTKKPSGGYKPPSKGKTSGYEQAAPGHILVSFMTLIVMLIR